VGRINENDARDKFWSFQCQEVNKKTAPAVPDNHTRSIGYTVGESGQFLNLFLNGRHRSVED
jgi:hypothetical protein